jgi:hypothetical protein
MRIGWARRRNQSNLIGDRSVRIAPVSVRGAHLEFILFVMSGSSRSQARQHCRRSLMELVTQGGRNAMQIS